MLEGSFIGRQLLSIYNCKIALLCCVGTGILYSLAYIYMMSVIGKTLAYLVVTLVWLGLLAATVIFGGMFYSPGTFGASESGKYFYIISALVAGIFFIIYNVMLWCGFS